jgi:outer membrane protein TolC
MLCTTAVAQQTYTLEMCREAALQNSKQAATARLTEEKTKYESRAYLSNFFPKISARGMYLLSTSKWDYSRRFSLADTDIPTMLQTLPPEIQTQLPPDLLSMTYDLNISLTPNNTYFAGIQAEQPIFTGGKIVSAYRMSKIGKEIAMLNINLTNDEILLQTDEAFFLHQKATESRKVAEAFLAVVNELLNNVQAAQTSGMKMKNDVLKVQVQLNRAELQLQKANNAVRLSRMNLCRIIGLPLNADIHISDSIEDAQETLQAADFTARPEYSILNRQIELKEQQIRLVRSDFLPNIGLLANFGYIRGLELNERPLLNQTAFSALISVQIPIFHWGEGLNKIRAAKAEKQIMQLQREDLNEKMELEMRQALDRMEESRLETRLTARALEQAEENMTTTQHLYESGMETLAAYLESQTLWQQAWLENIEAKNNLRLNETKYKKTVGGL